MVILESKSQAKEEVDIDESQTDQAILVAVHTAIIDGPYGVPEEVEKDTGLPRR